jgi:hypothetical protein
MGTFLAYAGSFSSTSPPWEAHNTIYMIPIAVVSAFLMCVCLMVDRAAATSCYYMLPFVEVFFAFPTIWAGFWILVYHFSPFGDSFNWGFALSFVGIDPLTLGATWMCGAIAGNGYLFGIVISASVYLLRRAIEINRFENSKIRADDETRYLWASTRTEREQANWFFHPVAFAVYMLIAVFSVGSFYQVFRNDELFHSKITIDVRFSEQMPGSFIRRRFKITRSQRYKCHV